MDLEALFEPSNQCGLWGLFFRSARYFRRASLNETPPMKNAVAARPIAYVPAPATMPQTTLPQPGKNFRIARAPSRRSIPAPTLAPSAVINSVAARKLRSRPLMYMIPETIITWSEVRIGRSAGGMGGAPMAVQIAGVDVIRSCVP